MGKKRTVLSTIAALSLGGFLAVGAIAPAQASTYSSPCGHTTFTSSTSTTVRDSGTGCNSLRARIDRYVGTNPVSYYGAENSSESSVSNSNGTFIQNYRNVKASSVWSGWLVA